MAKRKRQVVMASAKMKLSDAVDRLIGREYKLGGNGNILGSPIDCFGLINEYCKLRYDRDLIEENKDKYDFFGYEEKYNSTKKIVLLGELYRLIDKRFAKVLIPYTTSGDIIFCSCDGITSIGIYCGLQKVMIVTQDKGCIIVGTEHYKLEKVYRCPL